MTAFKSSLNDKFKIRYLSALKYFFFGLEVERSAKGIFFGQRHYVLEILNEYKATYFLMDPSLKLARTGTDLLSDPTVYIRLVGRLLYFTIARPSLFYSVQVVSQFMDKSTHSHMIVANRVLR